MITVVLTVRIKIGTKQARDKLGRFTKYMIAGAKEELEYAEKRITEIYREELEKHGIKSRSGRLMEGINVIERSPSKFRTVIGPSADRERIAEILEAGLEKHELPPRKGKVYVMQKEGEGLVVRSAIPGHHIRARNFMDDIIRNVERMANEELSSIYQISTKKIFDAVEGPETLE